MTSSAIPSIIDGYRKFKEKYYEASDAYQELVKEGQHPKVLMIACCDSRVDPAIVTCCKPGELFVIRNVANLVPPYEMDNTLHATSSALEFGVTHLEVSDIIIMGHSHCAGIRTLMKTPDDHKPTDFINHWIDIAKSARDEVLKTHSDCTLDEQSHECEKQSLLTSLENLKSFPWIATRVAQQTLHLHAWYFDLPSGQIKTYNEATNAFIPIDKNEPEKARASLDHR